MKIEIETTLEYGLMFLHDPYNDVEFPKDTGASPITYTNSCICFQVAPYLDGKAHVIISDNSYNNLMKPTFSKKIVSGSKFIGITDVPVNYYAILALIDDYADIDIWNYLEKGEECSWIRVKNLNLF